MNQPMNFSNSTCHPFTGALLEWYAQNARDLPWRKTSDPYAIWVSETMLQQTRVETVIPYYLRFLQQFPTLSDLAAATEAEALKAWEGLGYYRRIRLLHQGVCEVVSRHQGVIPASPEQLLALPGVGPYMAGAIASIAFGRPTPAIDGNVQRVVARQLAWGEPVEFAKSRARLRAWVLERFPPARRGDFTQSLMELGALVCLPRNPRCGECPVEQYCLGNEQPQCYPVKKASRPVPAERRLVVVIDWNGRRLLQQRPDTGLMAGFWEYPHLLAPRDAEALKLVSEWSRDVLGVPLEFQYLDRMTHIYTHLRWNLEIFKARWRGLKPPPTPERAGWFTPAEEAALPRVAFLRKLQRDLG
jgi:A/G-specific adenine glycosylase